MEDKLKFLYEIGRREQVEMYLRNQNIVDKLFQDLYKKRAECEKRHGHIKQVVKFDIRRTRNGSKKLYSLLNFVAYQLLVLAELQNKVEKRNLFGRYFYCLLYTSDAADEEDSVDLGGRRIIKK